MFISLSLVIFSFWIILCNCLPQKHDCSSPHILRSTPVSLDNSLVPSLVPHLSLTIQVFWMLRKPSDSGSWVKSHRDRTVMAQICTVKLSANFALFVCYTRALFKSKAPMSGCFFFLVLKNENWHKVDLTGSCNYSSSSSPCWEVHSRLWDAVRDGFDFCTKMGYWVLNQPKKKSQ